MTDKVDSRRRHLTGLTAGGLAMLAVGSRASAAAPAVGQAAPGFKAATLDGQTVTLDDLRGRVVVLNFWATWCAPCKIELPLLDAFYRREARSGLRVLAVTTEDSTPLSQLKPLAAALAFPMVRSIQGPYAPLGAVPTNYVIDRSGVLRWARAGAFDRRELERVVGPLLDRQAPPPGPAQDIA